MWESQTNIEEKKAFAYAHLKKPNDAFLAAKMVFPTDSGKALRAASEWPLLPDVLQFKKDLIEEYGEMHFIVSKADLIREVYDRANQCSFADDYFKGMGLVAKLSDYMPTNKTQVDTKYQPLTITLNQTDLEI